MAFLWVVAHFVALTSIDSDHFKWVAIGHRRLFCMAKLVSTKENRVLLSLECFDKVALLHSEGRDRSTMLGPSSVRLSVEYVG